MGKYSGSLREVAIGLESSRGTGVAPVYSLGKLGFEMFDKTVDARVEESIGHIADSQNKHVVEKYAQGGMEGELGANSALYLLGMALGGTPSAGGASDSVYPWTLTVANNNQHAACSIYAKDPNNTFLHKLAMLETLEIKVDKDGLVTYEAEFMSKVGVTSGQSMPSYAEDYKFTKRRTKIYIAANIAGLAGASYIPIKELTLKFIKNLVRDSNVGTVEPTDIQNTKMGIEGEIKLNREGVVYRNYMLDGDKKAFRFATSTEKLIGASTRGSIEIDLPKVDFFGWEPDEPNDDIAADQINFKANYDLTDGLVESATVNNALASM